MFGSSSRRDDLKQLLYALFESDTAVFIVSLGCASLPLRHSVSFVHSKTNDTSPGMDAAILVSQQQ
eukprot:SAG31_NODE_4247_length_3420_cov_2.633243_2_plen_66_part_00